MIESSDCVNNYAHRGFIAIPSHMIAASKEPPRLDFEEEMFHTERKGERQSDNPLKITRKEAAFDNHRIQIQKICACKLLQHMKLQFQVTFSIIHLIISLPQPSFVRSLTAKEHPHFGKHRKC